MAADDSSALMRKHLETRIIRLLSHALDSARSIRRYTETGRASLSFEFGKSVVDRMNAFFKNIDDLAEHLGMPLLELHRLIRNPSQHYKKFRLKKKSGGFRKITAPSPTLKSIQKWISEKLLPLHTVHDAAMGYRSGRSIVENARIHTAQDWVYNLDLEQFFPTIGPAMVEKVFLSSGFATKLARELTALTTFENQLPQGAPSSPGLANLVCIRLDQRLSALAAQRGWAYTRYCDDMTISGKGRLAERDEQLIRKIVCDEGFRVNMSKVRIARQNSRQVVTGLVVNRFVNADRQSRRRIRAMLHRYRQSRKTQEGTPSESTTLHVKADTINVSRLRGHLAYLRMIRKDDQTLKL